MRDQKLPFMFELWLAGGSAPAKTFILPINPETYKIIHPTRANVTQTKGGGWEDNAGPGLPKIYIQGTFGYLGSLPGGGGRHFQGAEISGWDLFKEFESSVFFDFYRQFGTGIDDGGVKVVDGPPYPDLRFYNFCDEDFFSVQIGRFEVVRSTQRRFLYTYTLEMTALKRLGDEQPLDSLAQSLTETPEPDEAEVGLWERILAGYTAVSSTVSDVINLTHDLRDKLAVIRGAVSAFRQGISDLIEAPFGLIDDAIGTVDLILDKTVSLTELPHEFTDMIRRTKRNMLQLRLNKGLFKVSSVATAAGETASATGTEIMTAALPSGQVAQTEGIVALDVPETSLFDPSLETTEDVSAAEEPVMGNDTLETIAARTLGDGRQWQRIAILNDLEYPYVVGEDPLASGTEILGSGTLETDAAAGQRILRMLGTVPLAGEILLLRQGEVFEFTTVENVDAYDGTITLETPLGQSFASGDVVTRHERKLSVLRPGDKVQIPGTRSGAATILGSEADFAAQVYGTDEYLDTGGAADDDRAGEVATVSGLDNLKMQLRHRLMTLRGELAALGHPDYGSILPLLIGQLGTDYIYERARLEAKLTLLQDPRIASVRQVFFQVEGTAIYLEADALPVNQISPRRMNLLLVA